MFKCAIHPLRVSVMSQAKGLKVKQASLTTFFSKFSPKKSKLKDATNLLEEKEVKPKISLSRKKTLASDPATSSFGSDAGVKSKSPSKKGKAKNVKQEPIISSSSSQSPIKKIPSPNKREETVSENCSPKESTILPFSTITILKPASPKKKSQKRKREDDPGSCDIPSKNTCCLPASDEVDDAAFLNENMSLFNDDWDKGEVHSSLDLTKLRRCRVESVLKNENNETVLELNCLDDFSKGFCRLLPPWDSFDLEPGRVVSVKGLKKGSNEFDAWTASILVADSDELISGTTVVGSLFCQRKTVLANFIKETKEDSNQVMFVGSLVHEFFQEALRLKISSLKGLFELYEQKVKSRDFIVQLFKSNLDFGAVTDQLTTFLPKIYQVVSTHFKEKGSPRKQKPPDSQWKGCVTGVLDIEENVWSPHLGIKGKIDVTIEAKTNKTKKIMPLELKTGKVSSGGEHRGQVILYCMMLSQILGKEIDSGLLLYLKDCQMEEVKAGEAEKRDLVLLRNSLAGALARSRVANLEPVPKLHLPPPIDHKGACSKCPYLTVCSAALRRDGLDTLEPGHALRQLSENAIAHLSPPHLDYLFHWMNLILMERSDAGSTSSPIWDDSGSAREEEGLRLSGLKVEGAVEHASDGSFLHTFVREDGESMKESTLVGKTKAYVIASNAQRLAITTGFVKSFAPNKVEVLLDRSLSGFDPPFHLDVITQSRAQSTISFTNLALLMEDNPRAAALRRSIIDLQVPKFAPKLSSKLRKVGEKIFARLNKDQTRSVLQVLSAEDYILVKGMPGTGKTSTIVALIELLVLLGKSVLLTSHTHSAVDNVLLDLIGRVDFLRLGAGLRARPELQPFSEEFLLQNSHFTQAKEIEDLYRAKPVVGVTCMGSSHSFLSRKVFDYCLVDEATQVDQPTVLRPLFAASKFVLIGDPQQLSPLVVNRKARENGFGVSLFERLERPAVISLLSLQYRMNSAITKIANGLTYNNQLKCGTPEVENATLSYSGTAEFKEDWMKKVMSKEMCDSVVFVDVRKSEEEETGKTLNMTEVDLVLKMLAAFKQVGVSGRDVGVISPYRAQVETLQREALEVEELAEVNTIDQYQGRDKKIIIFSCTHSSSPTAKGSILNSQSRLTVAVTRAKVKLILVGDKESLEGYSTFKKLFEHIPVKNFVKAG